MTQPKVTDAMAHKLRYLHVQSRRALGVTTEYAKGHSAGKAEGIADALKILGIEIDRINGGDNG